MKAGMPYRFHGRYGSAAKQPGVVLIEALIAMLIFMLGVLGLIGLGAVAVNTQSDAQYRTDAARFTDEIAEQMWLKVDRSSVASIQTSLQTFKHKEATTGPCVFTGTTSTNAEVVTWLAALTDATKPGYMPGATNVMQQIAVGTGADFNRITITVCWKTPADRVARSHTFVTLIN